MIQPDPTSTIAPHARHIREMLADLYDALDMGRPWSLVRLGDGELKVLSQAHAPLSHYENRVASNHDMAELRQWSIRAIQEADWIGWHQDKWLTQWMEAIGMLPQAYERGQYAWANLHMGIRRGFVERVLRDETIYLIGAPMQQWVDEYLRPRGLARSVLIWAGNSTISTAAEFYTICKTIETSGARIVLASMGIWAVPIAGYCKRVGKVGLDWGHLPDHNLSPDLSWNYHLNTCCPDSQEGTMDHYRHAHAPTCLPE